MLTTTLPPTPPVKLPESTDPVQALRDATRALHERLDRHLPLARPEATLSDYRQHLQVLRAWQMALMPWLKRTTAHVADLTLIDQDLADAPGFALPVSIVTSPMHRADDGSLAFCWGAAYVLEGSRLGGQVLYRRLNQRLAPHPLRYLHQRGAGGATWPETLATLRRQLGTAPTQASACAGAVAAFVVLLQGFDAVEGMPW